MTPTFHSLLGIDTPFETLAEAEHHLLVLGQRGLLPTDTMICTHEVRDASPHYAFSVAFVDVPSAEMVDGILAQLAGMPSMLLDAGPGEPDLLLEELPVGPIGLRQALAEAIHRHGGRAVTFPGSDQLVGTLPVRTVLDSSALDRLDVISGGPVDPEAFLDTRDFVRPRWKAGELVLSVMPAGAGSLAPFEVPNPTPCCADHL